MGGTVKTESVLGSHWMLNPQPAASPHSQNTKKEKHTKHLSKFKSQKTHRILAKEKMTPSKHGPTEQCTVHAVRYENTLFGKDYSDYKSC